MKGENEAFTVERLAGEGEGLRESWLALRRTGVGGSDVAALMGLSRYKGAYTLWAEKRGIAEPAPAGEAAEWGNRLEPVVAARYAEGHPDRTVRRVNGVCRSIERPWALASLDYEVRDPDAGWGVLEVKTVGLRRAADWAEGVPLYYQTQVQHYLDVTGRAFCDVAALVGGQEYREHRIWADAEDRAAIRQAVDAFWRLVESGEEPDPCALDGAALTAAHPGGPEFEEVEDALAVPEVRRWVSAKERADAAKADLDEAAAALKALVGDRRGIDSPTGRLTWRRGTRKRFDRRRFDAEHAGVYDSYCDEAASDMGLAWSPRKGA